jgi:hypothetical protein
MDVELLDLGNLTPEERNIILNVIRRDDELRQNQDNRIRFVLHFFVVAFCAQLSLVHELDGTQKR